MAKYHPDARFLTDYAAGSLPKAQALCVAAHLHYCSACRKKNQELTDLGTELFLAQSPAHVVPAEFDRLIGKIESLPPKPLLSQGQSSIRQASKRPAGTQLPSAIEKLTGGNLNTLNWYQVGKKFRYSPVNAGDSSRETTLFHIKAGGNVPHHRHLGDEITVILKGSFSDQDDQYQVGDFILRTPGETHSPVASQDEDCLCLSTLDAPIQMSNWFYRLLMPFIGRGSLVS